MEIKDCQYFKEGFCHYYNEKNPEQSFMQNCFLYDLKRTVSNWDIENCVVRESLEKIIEVAI